MNLTNFKFRIWDNETRRYILAPLISIQEGRVWINNLYAKQPHKDHLLEIELCSGIKDYKGIEVYEGDIIAVCKNKDKGLVSLNLLDGWAVKFEQYATSLGFWTAHDFEVIGNLKENAYLLNERKKEA